MNCIIAGTFIRTAGPRVERNKINFGRQVFEQPNQLSGICRTVIDAVQYHIFKGNPAAIVACRIVGAGLQEFFDRVALVDWDKNIADLISDRMQGDRKIDPQFFTALMDFRDNTGL